MFFHVKHGENLLIINSIGLILIPLKYHGLVRITLKCYTGINLYVHRTHLKDLPQKCKTRTEKKQV